MILLLVSLLVFSVTPQDPVLLYNNNAIINGSKTPIVPSTSDGSTDWVTFDCTSKGGYPKSKIHWTVDHELIQNTPENVIQDPTTSLYSIDSSLTVQFEREKTVSCIVQHDAYANEKTIWGVFAREYATSVVKIESNGEVLETETKISDGKEWHLNCVSDGMPKANEFEWKVDDKDWLKGVSTYTVNKPGKYACKARNMQSSEFILSQTVTFVAINTEVLGNFKIHSTQSTFWQAHRDCIEENSRLVEVYNKEKQDLLTNILQTSENACAAYWIGAIRYDETSNKSWYWLNSARELHYFNWCKYEPSPTEEQAVFIDTAEKCWRDKTGYSNFHSNVHHSGKQAICYICEKLA